MAVEGEADKTALLSISQLAGTTVKTRLSKGLSRVKSKIMGVYPSITDAAILSGLHSQGVTEVTRVCIKNTTTSAKVTTDQMILSFEGPSFSTEVRIGLKRHGAAVYQDTLQCFNVTVLITRHHNA